MIKYTVVFFYRKISDNNLAILTIIGFMPKSISLTQSDILIPHKPYFSRLSSYFTLALTNVRLFRRHTKVCYTKKKNP